MQVAVFSAGHIAGQRDVVVQLLEKQHIKRLEGMQRPASLLTDSLRLWLEMGKEV
jgi:hypothetical protein